MRFGFVLLISFLSLNLKAEDLTVFKLTIKNHKFSPDVIKVPANVKFKLEVKNEDPSSEEFESATLNIEKIMGPQKTLKLVLGPLQPGTYPFMGEFNQATARGELKAE